MHTHRPSVDISPLAICMTRKKKSTMSNSVLAFIVTIHFMTFSVGIIQHIKSKQLRHNIHCIDSRWGYREIYTYWSLCCNIYLPISVYLSGTFSSDHLQYNSISTMMISRIGWCDLKSHEIRRGHLPFEQNPHYYPCGRYPYESSTMGVEIAWYYTYLL